MSKKRVLSTLQLQSAGDLARLDLRVRDMLQTHPTVPCNALLTAGYALFKQNCLTQLGTALVSDEAEAEVSYALGGGFSLYLYQKQVFFCFMSQQFNLPQKEETPRLKDN